MSDCCSNNESNTKQDSCCANTTPRKAPCPQCNSESLAVATTTLLHQLKFPLNQQLDNDAYYFCSSADCDVIYFSLKGKNYKQSQLRQEVGQKSTAADRMLCYCFDIRADQVAEEIKQTGNSTSKEFVVEMTRSKRCACDIRNPSGQCCLKDFPK